MKRKVVGIYLRSAIANRDAIIAQLAKILKIAEPLFPHNRFDYQIYEEIAPGYNRGRDELKHLLNDCEKGKLQVVITSNVCRLSRNAIELSELIERFNNQNVRWISVDEMVGGF